MKNNYKKDVEFACDNCIHYKAFDFNTFLIFIFGGMVTALIFFIFILFKFTSTSLI